MLRTYGQRYCQYNKLLDNWSFVSKKLSGHLLEIMFLSSFVKLPYNRASMSIQSPRITNLEKTQTSEHQQGQDDSDQTSVYDLKIDADKLCQIQVFGTSNPLDHEN